MRNWNNKLFVDAMPGRRAPLSDWIAEVAENGIDVVVCLTTDQEISEESPDYAELRTSKRARDGQDVLSLGDQEVVLRDFPITDYSAPAKEDVEPFWVLAAEIANRTEEGFRVFVHCGAGIGRTGTFATAVLMTMGKSIEDALREIGHIGPHPETDDQNALLAAGPSTQLDEPDIEKDPIAYADWMNGHSQFLAYQTFREMRPRSPLTQRSGLRAILDPTSQGWHTSTPDEKLAALRAVCLVHNAGTDASAFQAARTQIQIVNMMYPTAWIPEDYRFLAASLLFQAAVDAAFDLPTTEEAITSWREKQDELKGGNPSSSLETPNLGRYVFDSMGAEGESISVTEKINRLKTAIKEGHSVLELVSVYLDQFGERTELRTQALDDLFALTAVAHLAHGKQNY